MSGENWDAEGVDTAVNPGVNDIVDPAKGERTGDPAIDDALDEGEGEDEDNNERTRKTHKTIKDAADDLDDEDRESGDKMRNGTELSSANGSPSGYSPTQQMPLSQTPQTQTPQVQSPQMTMPQVQSPQMPRISSDQLNKLVSNYSPKTSSSGDMDKMSRSSDSGVSGSDKISVGDVEYKMKEGPPLTRGQFDKVLEEAMDRVGIPEDRKVREEWKELYQYMAQAESSRNGNAYAGQGVSPDKWASHSDYNVRKSVIDGVPTKGPDGAPIHTSRGILQCIPSTFASYHVAGTSKNIYDPLASVAASMNYVISDPKYNVSADGTGLSSFAAQRGFPNGPYRGY